MSVMSVIVKSMTGDFKIMDKNPNRRSTDSVSGRNATSGSHITFSGGLPQEVFRIISRARGHDV